MARFVTLNTHQLAGHVANLDFWVSEARHALEVIDGYEPRFRRMKAGQDQHVAERGTFTEATYRFLVRCCNEGLIPESKMRAICEELDIGVEAADLR